MKSQDGHVHEGLRRGGRVRADGQSASGRQRRLLKRWPVRLFLFFGLLAAAVAWPLACATVIVPPPAPADPVQVYLIDEGHTSSLVLPTSDGNLMLYVYGNWEWYALLRQNVYTGLRALFWRSPAALGRHLYPGPPDPPHAAQLFGAWSQHLFIITVNRGKELQLADTLDRRFRRNLATLHVNTAYNLDFVRDPAPYDLFHDSNHEIARWLETLGCRVHGPAIYANWKVIEKQGGPPVSKGPP